MGPPRGGGGIAPHTWDDGDGDRWAGSLRDNEKVMKEKSPPKARSWNLNRSTAPYPDWLQMHDVRKPDDGKLTCSIFPTCRAC
jgi:hypothetical protein